MLAHPVIETGSHVAQAKDDPRLLNLNTGITKSIGLASMGNKGETEALKGEVLCPRNHITSFSNQLHAMPTSYLQQAGSGIGRRLLLSKRLQFGAQRPLLGVGGLQCFSLGAGVGWRSH